jgi:putative protein-disulfide isomerase
MDVASKSANAGGINITYYTDPLCCWSWAFEPAWQQLLSEFKDEIAYSYCMGGLLPDWKNFHDQTFSISRPAQMGPVWMQASHASGRYIYDRLWMEDPPASSYPACIAVKCAQVQSFEAGEIYLRHAWQAAMTMGINLANEAALIKIADDIEMLDNSLLQARQFKEDLYNGKGLELFKKDLQEVQYKRINRFPSLAVACANQPTLLIEGYKPYQLLKDTIVKNLCAA